MNSLNQMVVLASYPTIWEAEIVVGRLQAEGIDAQLRDQHIVSTNWLYSNAVGGVKVMVPHDQLEMARSILEAPIEEYEEDTPPGWGSCIECGSTDLEPITSRRSAWISYLLLGFPLFAAKRKLHCLKCGHLTDNGISGLEQKR